jgi:hypothetical protein
VVLAPVAMAQETTMMGGGGATMMDGGGGNLPGTGGSAIVLPAGALLLGSGVLTYAILRRR